jgi:hypothetical protein
MSAGTKMTLNKYGKQNLLDKTDYELVIDASNVAQYTVPIIITLPEDYVMGRGELDVYFNGQHLTAGGGYEEPSPNTIILDVRDLDGNPSPLNIGDEIFIRMWRTKTVQGLEADRDRINSIEQEIREARNSFPKLDSRLDSMDERLNRRVIVIVVPGAVKLGVQDVEIRFPFSGVIAEVYASCKVAPTTDLTLQIEKIGQDDYDNDGTWQPVLSQPIVIDADTKSSRTSSIPYVIGVSEVSMGDLFRVNVPVLGDGVRAVTIEITVNCTG